LIYQRRINVTEPTPVVSPRRAAVAFVFITVVLDVLALGMIIPVLPKLVTSFLGGNIQRAAEIFGVFGTIWALMQFIFSPLLGALSDRFGRRTIILLSNFGLGLDYVLMALAPTLGWLFVGRVISGITAASIPTAFAYISDVTSAEKRSAAFGLMGGAFGLGFVLGPALGGWLGTIDTRLPFWVAAALSLANAMYGLFVLPESLPRERRSAFDPKKANPVGSLKLLRSHHELFGLASVIFLTNLAHEVLPSVFVLYAAHRYAWTPRDVGFLLAGVGVCTAIVQGGLIRPVIARFGERVTVVLGLLFGAAGLSIYGLAPTGTVLWCGLPVLMLWGFAGPPAQGLMSRRVSASEQGQLQGAGSSLRGITGLIGPGLFTFTFAKFIGDWRELHLPGAPFLLAASLLAIGAPLAWWVTRTRRNEVAAKEIVSEETTAH